MRKKVDKKTKKHLKAEDTNKKTNKKSNKKVKKTVKRLLLILLVVILIAAGIAAGKLYSIIKNAKLDASQLAITYENSVVKDINGDVVAVLCGDESRELVTLSEMSPYLPKAFISIEDERFREHSGIDIKRTAAATVKWGLSKIGIGSASYGGSTITQQLVKNLTKENERSSTRKIKEMARAYYIEKELSKDQILELYLNLILLGGRAYGVEVASNYYFSKTAQELTLAESAFLAGINNSPNAYNPFDTETDRTEKIKTRTKTVLAKMLELNNITQEEYDNAVAEVENGLAFKKGTITQNVYSYHTDAAVEQVIKDLMKEHEDWSRKYTELYVKSSGLTIYSTQNTTIQKAMETEFANTKYQVNSRINKDEDGNWKTTQAAMVLMDHSTGYVLATVGGLGEKTTSFGLNRATQSKRQTGSSMKPLAVLVPGIENGIITAATSYDDVPTTFAGGTYPVKNSTGYKGLVTIRYAIAASQNIPMVKAMQQIGPTKSIEYLKQLGISTLDDEKDNYLGLALGGVTNGITPLEMAAAYATIANDGVYIEPTFYTKVVDQNGNTVLEAKQESRTVMSKAASFIIKDILTQVVKTGTSPYCRISGMAVAAKTGTTNKDYDRWLCGFTPYYTAATWFGYDSNEEVRWGGTNPAGLLWAGTMKEAHKGLESKSFTKADGVETVVICKSSGKLATELCKTDPRGDQSYTEYFIKGTKPKDECDCHVKVKICNQTGLLATDYCTDVTEQVYITRPDAQTSTAWKVANDAKYTLTITESCNVHTQSSDKEKPVIKLKGDQTVTVELNGSYVEEGATATDNVDGDISDKIEISGNVDTKKEGTYKITYTVKDKAGNVGTATRTVIVKSKSSESSKPEIRLNGEATINLKVGDSYTDPGATASDSKDGDLTSKISKTGEVDTSKAGTYTITYKVKNSSGKEASVTRTVIVK